MNGSPAGGDAGDSLSTAGNVGYGATTVALGTTVAGTSPAVVTVRGYAGRFELEIPAGATIDAVIIEFSAAAAGINTTSGLSGGFLAADSVWPASGFNASSYATRASFPWPRRYNGSALVDNLGAFQGGAAAFSGAFPRATAAGQLWSFGDATTAEHSVSGLVAQLQAFIDGEPAGIRSGSVSGTALPIAFALVPSAVFGGTQGVRTADYGSTAPVLGVSYTPSNAPPTVSITSPSASSTVPQGNAVSFAATSTDPEDGALVPVWTSSLDGAIGSGNFSSSSLSVGSHTITATATDSGSSTGSDSVTLAIDAIPTITTDLPETPLAIGFGESVTFTATANDPETGALTPQWSSSLDGTLAKITGYAPGLFTSINTSTLSVGVHTITASVTDFQGSPAADSGVVEVRAPSAITAAAAQSRPALSATPRSRAATTTTTTTRPATSSRGRVKR